MLPRAAQSPYADLGAFVSHLLAACMEIRSVWSIDHDPEEACNAQRRHRLLVFGDTATLGRLHKCELLHAEGVELLVVVDEDAFVSAWGAGELSGSLARWAWRQTSAHEAYYDESRWASAPDAGAVVRVRRKALLVWQAGGREYIPVARRNGV